ncbi:MAG: sugar-binding protein [Anaerolineales bacterium]
MNTHRMKLLSLILLLAALACTLPGTESPTPFVFPTPNLTLTAIHQPTNTEAVEATETPLVANATATPSPSPDPTSVEISPTDTPKADVRPNGQLLTAIRLQQPPTIDANLEEWPNQRYSATEVVYGRSNWSSGSDLSASFILAWDEANLYLAADVNDDTHVQLGRGNTIYQGDSLEILLDAMLHADFNTTQLSPDDFQVGLSPGDFNSRPTEAYRWFPRSVQGGLTSLDIEAAATTDGYLLEAAIPWIVFGVEPEVGDLFGFAFSVSDNDLAATTVQQSMVSSVASRSLTDPTTWGTLILGSPED